MTPADRRVIATHRIEELSRGIALLANTRLQRPTSAADADAFEAVVAKLEAAHRESMAALDVLLTGAP